MSLSHKSSELRRKGNQALRLASFLDSLIIEHGEEKAAALYKSACERKNSGDLNVHKKSVEWEGLTLSRQPNAIEQIAVKGISEAQEDGKKKIAVLLLELREELITDAIKKLLKLTPDAYHELILVPPAAYRKRLLGLLTDQYERGRKLVEDELGRQGKSALSPKARNWKATDDDEGGDEIDSLTSITLSTISNDIQSRASSIALKLAAVGVIGSALKEKLKTQLDELSTAVQEQTASGISNRVLGLGRSDEAEARGDEWEKVQYSALLDRNTCSTCEESDGKESADESDLPDAPNTDCEGGYLCRCFHVYIAAGG